MDFNNTKEIGRFHDKAVELLKQLAKDYGMTVEQAGGQTKETEMTLKFKFETADKSAVIERRRKEFNDFAAWHSDQVKAEWFGMTINDKGKTLEIVGIKRRSKNCIELQCTKSGTYYKCSPSFVQSRI